MALNPSIILSGANPDILGAMSRGNELAAQTNTLRDQNALRQVYQTQGAGLLQGNQSSLNALAMIDPVQALNVQGGVLRNQTAQRSFEIMNAQEKRAIAEAARTMDEAQKAAAAEATRRQVQQFVAAPSPEVWDQLVTQAGKPELRGQWANRQVIAAEYVSSVEEALKLSQGPEQPAWRAATSEEAAARGATAGQINTKTGEFKAGPQNRSSRTEVLPDGTIRVIDEAGAVGAPGQTVGDVYKPGTTDQAIGLIDQIANSPALERITGPWEGGGGNNIDEMSAARRAWYGEAGLDAIEKINQLQSQAWMAAREMLKGGGQITDYESKKAEAAVARLSRAKGTDEFRAALRDLRDAITEGEAKLRAAQGGATVATPQTPSTPAAPAPSPEAIDLLRSNNTPEYRSFFDQVFGEGAAARVLGGN